MSKTTVSKSYYAADPIQDYCIRHSTVMHPIQQKLIQETLQHSRVSELALDNFYVAHHDCFCSSLG